MSHYLQTRLTQLQPLTPEQCAQLCVQISQQQSGGANLGVGNTIGQTGDIVAGDQTRGVVDNDGRIDGVAVGVNLGTIVYGRAPEEDERRRLVWYLTALSNKLRGLDARLDESGQGMSLGRMYVELASTELKIVKVFDQKSPKLRAFFEGVSDQNTLATRFSPDWSLPSEAVSHVLQVNKKDFGDLWEDLLEETASVTEIELDSSQ